MTPGGSDTVPAECADLAASMPALNALYDPSPTTTTDLPNEVADFTGSGAYSIGLEY